jgi:hypothetical protein
VSLLLLIAVAIVLFLTRSQSTAASSPAASATPPEGAAGTNYSDDGISATSLLDEHGQLLATPQNWGTNYDWSSNFGFEAPLAPAEPSQDSTDFDSYNGG